MTYGQAAALVRNPRVAVATRRRLAAQLAAYDRAHRARHATALRRPPVRVPSSGPGGMRGLTAALPAPAAALAAPILQVEQVGTDLANGIAHLLGGEDSLAASRCEPGRPGWPGCAIPGGSIGALIDAGASPAQAAHIAASVAATGQGIGGGGRPPADRGLLRTE